MTWTIYRQEKILVYPKLPNNCPPPLVEKNFLVFTRGGGAIIRNHVFVKNKAIFFGGEIFFLVFTRGGAIIRQFRVCRKKSCSILTLVLLLLGITIPRLAVAVTATKSLRLRLRLRLRSNPKPQRIFNFFEIYAKDVQTLEIAFEM